MKIKKLSETATSPDKNHNAAGFDLYASKDVVIEPGQKAIIPTDIAIELPENTFAHIVGRSGITAKTHLNVLTGTIDNDYRGALGIIVQNTLPAISHHNRLVYDLEINKLDRTVEKIEVSQPRNSYLIKKGDKVAQLVLYKSVDVELEVVDDLTSTSRNENGFGSSGV